MEDKYQNNNALMGGGKPPRQSNFELLRIVAMFLVLVIHAFHTNVVHEDGVVSNSAVLTLLRYVIVSFSLVCVNSFILISGYFRIRPSFRSVLSFLFLVIFWRIFTAVAVWFYQIHQGLFQPPTVMEVCRILLPASVRNGDSSWFIETYILLMFFAPILNEWIDKVSLRHMAFYVFGYVAFEIVFNYCLCTFSEFNLGYSLVSFVGLYLIGALIFRLQPRLKTIRFPYFAAYVLVSVVAGGIYYAAYIHVDQNILCRRIIDQLYSYNSPSTILASALLFLAFSRLSFSSRFINTVAKSAFAVYLFHMHPLFADIYFRISARLMANPSAIGYFFSVAIFILVVFISTILIDRLRILLWNYISGNSRRVTYLNKSE